MLGTSLVLLLGLSLLPPAFAIHCDTLRELTAEDKNRPGNVNGPFNLLDPTYALIFDYRIVRFQDCWMRVQNAGDPSRGNNNNGNTPHWTSAIVRDKSPSTTAQGVTDTINNFSGAGGTNSQLWISGGVHSGAWALAYMGWPGYWQPGKTCYMMDDPQDGLWGPNSALTLILPGVVGTKLQTVNAISSQLGRVADLAGSLLGMSLKDGQPPLTEEDYAYVSFYELGWAAFERFLNRDTSKHYALAYTNLKDNDPGWKNSDCVVIDLRDLIKIDNKAETAQIPVLDQNGEGRGQRVWKMFGLNQKVPPTTRNARRRWVPLPQL